MRKLNIDETKTAERLKNSLSKLSFSPSAVFLPAIIYFFNAGYIVLLTVFAVLIHEIGHFVVLRFFKGDVIKIEVWAGGVSMKHESLGYKQEALTAAGGPAVSLIMAILSSLAGKYMNFVPLYHFAGLNLLFCIFNLLPIYPLDGGKILFSLTSKAFGIRIGERVRFLSSIIAIVISAALGIAIFIKEANPTLIISTIWLINSLFRR